MRSLYKRAEIDDPAVFSLEYFIFCEDNNRYGLEIVKRVNEECVESRKARNLCESRGEIEQIADRLFRGQVTPVALEYIVEDMLYENYYQRVAAAIC